MSSWKRLAIVKTITLTTAVIANSSVTRILTRIGNRIACFMTTSFLASMDGLQYRAFNTPERYVVLPAESSASTTITLDPRFKLTE